MNIKNRIPWKQFFILLAAGVASVVAIFPYILTMQGEVLSELPIPLPVVFLASVMQSTVLLAIAIFVGLLLGKKVGLRTPLLSHWLDNQSTASTWRDIARQSTVLGILVGVAIIVADKIFLLFIAPIESVSAPVWQGFLASFYGGVVEEMLLRLFLMTLLVWIFSKLGKQKNTPSAVSMWTAIILASIIFGLCHLPATVVLTDLTPLVVVRAIVLNSIGGVVFGWLYWKKGLESAMIAHFTADLVLLVFLPLFLRLV